MLAKKTEQAFDNFMIAIVPKPCGDAEIIQLTVDSNLHNQTGKTIFVGTKLTPGQLASYTLWSSNSGVSETRRQMSS